MSSRIKWKESFQSISQTSLSNSNPAARKPSLLDEGDLSVSDDELEQYLGTIKKKSGLNRLWTGNTFDRVIDRTPDVSISFVSDGEVAIDEDKNQHSDSDFLPNVMALPSVATENNNTDISEPSSIKPFQAVKLMSDLEFSDEPLELANNVKLALSGQESGGVLDNDIKSFNKYVSSAEEVQTLDEISEEIEEDLSGDSKTNENLNSNTRDKSHRSDSSERSESTSHRSSPRNKRRSKSRSDSKHSASGSKSKQSSKRTSEHSPPETSRKQTRKDLKRPKSGSSRHSHKTDASSRKSDDSYTSDFSESSKQKETASSKKSSLYTESAVSSKIVKSNADISKKTSKDRMNQRFHDVATQVNMNDVGAQKLGVGMATLGPSLGHRYVDPSPIARHVVDADAIEASMLELNTEKEGFMAYTAPEDALRPRAVYAINTDFGAVTAYNPAVVALTDMLRQQLRLVEQFVDNSRRMYESYTNNLNTTYRYTTLEDTLQFIDESRRGHQSPTEPVTK